MPVAGDKRRREKAKTMEGLNNMNGSIAKIRPLRQGKSAPV
jgi:hypothetical protein